jgi:regulatory protein
VARATDPTPGSPADLQPEADPESVARGIVLRRLTAAPRSRADLSTDLLRRGIPADVVERVLDRFTDVGLIDDAAYARLWVASRQRTRASARSVLRQELRAKGIGDDDVRDALAEVDPDEERSRGMDLVRRRAASLGRYDHATRRRRLAGLLVRRGFPPGQAVAMVDVVLSGASGADGDGGEPDRFVGGPA